MEFFSRYMWVLWDIAAIVVFVMFVRSGAARGLIRTLLSFASYIVAMSVARFASPIISESLYDNVVKQMLHKMLYKRLDEYAGSPTSRAAPDEVMAAIPDSLQRFLDGDVMGSMERSLDMEIGRIIENLVDNAPREPIISVINGFVFLILFTVIILIFRHLSHLFKGLYNVPVLGTINTLLGGVIGVFQGALALLVLALAARLVVEFTGGWFWLNDQVLNDTYIWRVFYYALWV